LRATEERFAKVFKANPQPMSLMTLDDGTFIDVNESFLNFSFYSRSPNYASLLTLMIFFYR